MTIENIKELPGRLIAAIAAPLLLLHVLATDKPATAALPATSAHGVHLALHLAGLGAIELDTGLNR